MTSKRILKCSPAMQLCLVTQELKERLVVESLGASLHLHKFPGKKDTETDSNSTRVPQVSVRGSGSHKKERTLRPLLCFLQII